MGVLSIDPTNIPNFEMVEYEYLVYLLTHFEGNVNHTAVAMGVSFKTIYNRVEKFKLKHMLAMSVREIKYQAKREFIKAQASLLPTGAK